MESVCGAQEAGQGWIVALEGTGVALVAVVGVITVAGGLENRQPLTERIGIGTRYAMRKMQLLGLG